MDSDKQVRYACSECDEFVHGVPYHLGYGLTHPIALEGALKLKEIAYAHCEGIDPDFPRNLSKTLTVD